MSLINGQTLDDFAGLWKQEIPVSSPGSKPRTPKQLNIKIDHDILHFILTGSGKVHEVNITFQIGGPEVSYTGLDGDEFRMKLTQEGQTLVFDGTEHERGSDHHVREVWAFKEGSKSQVLLDTRSAGEPNEPGRASEYKRVKP